MTRARQAGVDALVQALAVAAVASTPELGWMAAGSAPVVSAAVQAMWDRVIDFRLKNVSTVVASAADAAELSPGEVIDRLTTHDDGLRFLAGLIHAAQDVAAEGKIAALAESARRVVSGEVSADVEDLMIRALADLETPHAVVLRAFGSTREQLGLPPHDPPQVVNDVTRTAFKMHDLVNLFPQLGNCLPVVLATLSRHAMISAGPPTMEDTRLPLLASRITTFGREVNERLQPQGQGD